jgi:hypothetical protein
MKNIMLVIAAVFSLGAFAADTKESKSTLTCSNMAGDGGYAVIFKSGGKKASLIENNIAGAIVRANLTCKSVKSPHVGADTMDVVARCTGKGTDGEKYEVTLSAGGFWFHQDVDIFVNGKPVAMGQDILCKQ